MKKAGVENLLDSIETVLKKISVQTNNFAQLKERYIWG